jgi:hypothetical protein
MSAICILASIYQYVFLPLSLNLRLLTQVLQDDVVLMLSRLPIVPCLLN